MTLAALGRREREEGQVLAFLLVPFFLLCKNIECVLELV